MPGLIQKSGYIRQGNGGGHYAEYIATREGVELLESPPPHQRSGYLEYMAERPRSHGLFSADGPANLAYRAGVDLRLLSETGGFPPAGLREQRELSQVIAGPSDRIGNSDENSAKQFSLVCRLPR